MRREEKIFRLDKNPLFSSQVEKASEAHSEWGSFPPNICSWHAKTAPFKQGKKEMRVRTNYGRREEELVALRNCWEGRDRQCGGEIYISETKVETRGRKSFLGENYASPSGLPFFIPPVVSHFSIRPKTAKKTG